MIEILPAPDHVVALRMSDRLTAADYERVFAQIDTKLKEHEHIGLYTDARQLRGLTPSALLRDVQYGFKKLGEYRRFGRAAVVTDGPFLRALARAGDTLFPTIELRTFAGAHHDMAMSWVTELPARPRTPALRLLRTTRADTLAFVWDGTISEGEAAEVIQALEEAIAQHGTIRLLGRVEHLGGVTPGALKHVGRLTALKRRALRKVERYAVVGGPNWLPRWVATVARVFAIDIRHFAREDEQAAWSWLEAQPLSDEGATANPPPSAPS